MSKVPSVNYTEIVRALERDGWSGVRQRGSHIRMHKIVSEEVLKVTIPAHNPVKRWVASAFIATEKSFRRIKGHKACGCQEQPVMKALTTV